MSDETEQTHSTHFISNTAGTRIGLHFYSAQEPQSCKPLVLAHGTFSNHRACRGLARFLSRQGFDCWILDSQGHGISDKPQHEPDFETMYLQDAAAVMDFLAERYPGQKVSWVGHSGGGLAILMYLARHPQQQERFVSIVTLASQATDAALKPGHRIAIRLAATVTALLGFAPGKWLKLGPEHEFASVMQQWYCWSLSENWRGSDGFDYLDALSTLQLPLLSIAGEGDHFIAPASGCLKLHQRCTNRGNKWLLCGTANGFSENFTHARIISSRSAANEIWPAIADWLRRFTAAKTPQAHS